MKTSSSCELTPRVPSPPPCQLPPGPWTSLASSALCLDCLHANPSTTSVDQSAEACPYPTTVRLSGCRWRPTSSKDAAKRRVKSGNFNWFYRQFYYALNKWAKVLLIVAILAPGERTVAAILRVMGLQHERQFQNYHRGRGSGTLVKPSTESSAAG